ncbi:MAG: hypothetical protein AUJ48_03360 [Deltaproteobacteria bacterium CG1_02_45_11]|nr:MAG: hypothetical protein AUJ48_03360 [Deltaproteobacteria bacterium CG1_02_45_11]
MSEAGLRYRWAILGICWLGYIIALMQRLSIGPLAPFLKEGLNLTNSQIGMITFATFFGYMLALVPSGTIVDRFNEKAVLILSEMIGGIFVGCLFFASRYYQMLIIMAFCGMALGSILPATTKAIFTWFSDKERATAMGIKHTAINIGGIIGSITLPPLALALSWRHAFLAMGFLGIGIGVLTLMFYRSAHPGVSINGTTERVKSDMENAPLIDVIKNKNIVLVTLVGLCAAVEFAIITYFVLFLNESLGYAVVTAGFLLAVLEGGGALGKPILGFISDRILDRSRKKAYLVVTTTWCLACILMAFVGKGEPVWILILLCVILGASTIGWSGIHFTFIAELGGERLVGRATGVSTFVMALGAMAWPPMIGMIIDLSGSYKIAWLAIALLGMVASFLLLMVREKEGS